MRLIGKLIKFILMSAGVLIGSLVAIGIAVAIFGDTDENEPEADPSPTRQTRLFTEPTTASESAVKATEASEPVAQTSDDQQPADRQSFTCANFDSWMWAQAVYDQDPDTQSGLDPDGNGIACDQLTVYGFAPVTFTDKIPDGTTKVTLVSVTDGDTIKVRLPDGSTDTVRLLHIDTPETTGTVGQCGGTEATNYLGWILSYAGGGTLYLESDETERDRYDRRLAYVWFSVDGDSHPYMANHAMVMSGWAESESFGPDTKYKSELDEAEQFSVAHVTGVRLLCGKFGLPANDAGPSEEQIRQAWLKQPNQGQLPPLPGSAVNPSQPSVNPVTANEPQQSDPAVPDSAPAQDPVVEQPPAQAPAVEQPPAQEPVVEQPPVQEPVVEQPPVQEPANECDPSYPDICLAPAYVIGDLDCGDVGYTNFRVFPPDSHGFDGNGDGYGCEGG